MPVGSCHADRVPTLSECGKVGVRTRELETTWVEPLPVCITHNVLGYALCIF